MKTLFATLALTAAAGLVATAEPVLVEKGRPVSEIVPVVDIVVHSMRGVNPAQWSAAEELQRWIGEMTDAFVPIRRADEPAREGVKSRVILEIIGRNSPYADDFKAISGTDGFAVRHATASNGVEEVRVIAVQGRGILNGVYSLLERNSDIIWPRPEPALSAVFSRTKDFALTVCDYREVPVRRFITYAWNGSSKVPDLEWYSRNYGNVFRGAPASYGSSYVGAGSGHGFPSYTSPKENFAAHPDWYALVGGERKPTQVCFLAYDAVPTIVSNMVREIQTLFPGKNPRQVRIDYFNLSNPDSWVLCQCEKCTAPFTCEDGTVVQPEDPAFRSAQNFTLKNKIAREIRKIYPDVVIGDYAYYYTVEPPPFKLENNIRVQYCPYGENMKVPIYDDEYNALWHRLLDGWGKSCNKAVYRTYTGCGDKFPRPLEYILQTNFLYCLTRPLPLREIYNEGPLDYDGKDNPGHNLTWDTCAMLKWLIPRLAWNPRADLEELRRDFCRRAYREAAEPMLAFNDLLRDSFFSDRLPCFYNAVDGVGYTRHYIIRPKLEGKLFALLDEALAKARHPVSRELIARQKARFEVWVEKAGDGMFVQMNVPYSAEKDLETSFDSDVWKKAGKTGDFIVASPSGTGGGKARFRTTASILHDRVNLFIRFDCYAPDMATLKASVSDDGKERAPRGDIMEFYLANGSSGVYYMMMMDAGNDDPSKDCVYDAKMWDNDWNSGWTRNVRRYGDRWTTIVKVPFESIGVAAAQGGKLLFQGIRQKFHDTDEIDKKTGAPKRVREFASWNGGWVHQTQTFGELILDLE